MLISNKSKREQFQPGKKILNLMPVATWMSSSIKLLHRAAHISNSDWEWNGVREREHKVREVDSVVKFWRNHRNSVRDLHKLYLISFFILLLFLVCFRLLIPHRGEQERVFLFTVVLFSCYFAGCGKLWTNTNGCSHHCVLKHMYTWTMSV